MEGTRQRIRMVTPSEAHSSFTADVVAACQQGNRDAQRALYEEFHLPVYRLALRMVGRDDAEDLAQQIFLCVFQKIRQFGGRAQFSTWLYRLATNECLQHLRSQSRHSKVPLSPDTAGHSKSRPPDLDSSELLQTAISRLEPDLRAVFVLREIEELNYSQLSEALQIPEGTVASQLSRARKQLRAHLIELGWES